MIEGIELGRIASHKLPSSADIEPLVPDQDKTSSCHSEFKLCIDLKHLQLPVKNAPAIEPVQMIDTTEAENDV